MTPSHPPVRGGEDEAGPPSGWLRSSRWLEGDNDASLQHRAALRSVGLEPGGGRPVVGISNTVSDLNPCNATLTDQIAAAREAVLTSGGIPVVFPTISLGEDLMKPTALLYRNLLSIEVEEMVRAHPIDALILTANCDKTIPGALMGAISANIPTVLMLGGARPNGQFQGHAVASGTDLWKQYDAFRAGQTTAADWAAFERCYSCGPGACNVMGTATTMAILAETLGFTVSGASLIPAGDSRGVEAARRAGELAVHLAHQPIRPSDLVTEASLANAIAVLAACGGSTNALIHLTAMAGRAGIRLAFDQVAAALAGIQPLVDLQPVGRGFAADLDASGGVPAVLRAVKDRLDLDCPNIEAHTLADVVGSAPAPGGVVRAPADPVAHSQTIRTVRGSLAPDGAVIKAAAATPDLLTHRGPAVVFDSYDDMRRRIDDPGLDVTAESVLILRNAGPVGGPGMPEWGMVPIPAKLVAEGVKDMVRISDARMSGTSFGTVVLHVSPEAAVGGPLALVQDGDVVELDAPNGRLNLLVGGDELERRRSTWAPPPNRFTRGWIALHCAHVTQASQGCDLDFLLPNGPGDTVLIEPTVGRS